VVDTYCNKPKIDVMFQKLLKNERVEIIDWTNSFIEKYRPALEALAKYDLLKISTWIKNHSVPVN